MSPFKSIKGRALGKLLEGYKSSDIGKGFGEEELPISPITATGGTKVTNVGDGYIYHVYEQVQVGSPKQDYFTVTAGNNTVEVLVIGGGGGGGSMPGTNGAPEAGNNGSNPGGGGGGAAVGPVGTLRPGSYPLTVGAGGRGRGATAPGPNPAFPANTFGQDGEPDHCRRISRGLFGCSY